MPKGARPNRPQVCQTVGMALLATKGDENSRGSGAFDEARKGWPPGLMARGPAADQGVRPTSAALPVDYFGNFEVSRARLRSVSQREFVA
jgi:hypothetical protein